MPREGFTSAMRQWLPIDRYDQAEFRAMQHFIYSRLVCAVGGGVVLVEGTLRRDVAVGLSVIVAAGLFTLWRERQQG